MNKIFLQLFEFHFTGIRKIIFFHSKFHKRMKFRKFGLQEFFYNIFMFKQAFLVK